MIRPALAPYVPVADLIAKTFGDDCEVVLHDFSAPRHSVVYVANGLVTGRQVGESFRHLISKAVEAKEDEDGVIANYCFREKGKLIRSSSLLIRDETRSLVGALCVNVDMTRAEAAAKWLRSIVPAASQIQLAGGADAGSASPGAADDPDRARAGRSMTELASELIDRIVAEEPPGRLTRERRLELIRFMDEKDVFLVKGALERVADRLGVSKVTVYSDLDEVRGKR